MPDTHDEPGDGKVRRRALVVGIDDYPSKRMHLSYCVDDAKKLRALLERHGYQVTGFHGGRGRKERATRANVEAALRALVTVDVDEDDVVLFYFCGHGRLLKGAPYLFMADTPNTDAGVRERGFALADVLKILRKGTARWCAVFLDACNMGIGVDKEFGFAAARHSAQGGGFALLSGSTMGDVTQDAAAAGIFSTALLAGLDGGAADPDGGVRFSALARYIQHHVARWKADPAGGGAKAATQTPVMRLEVSDLQVLSGRSFVDLSPGLGVLIRAAAFSPDGTLLATGSDDNTVRLWDAHTGKQLGDALPCGEQILDLAFSPDGGLLAASMGMVRVWTVPDMVRVPIADVVGGLQLAWSRDRTLVTSIGDMMEVHRFDASGHVVESRPFTGHGASGFGGAVAFAPDGSLVSGGGDRTVRTWNVATGECTKVLKVDVPVWVLAVSPDGRHVAIGGMDLEDTRISDINEVRVVDRKTGAVVRRLVGHVMPASRIAYASGGTRIVTTGHDGSSRVWNARTGVEERTLDIETTSSKSVTSCYGAVSPDGSRVFVGFSDGRGRIFALDPDD